jgi:hypothetical protein
LSDIKALHHASKLILAGVFAQLTQLGALMLAAQESSRGQQTSIQNGQAQAFDTGKRRKACQ